MMNAKKTVLVIDDELDLCELIKIMLTKENYFVECAGSLAEAGFKLKNKPDIVLLDNNLPDGRGIDYIQMHPIEFLESYVVMMTADTTRGVETEAKKEGIPIFIHKPFSIEKIKDIIHRAA